MYCIKVSAIGDAKSGKTSVIRALNELPYSEKYEETRDVRIWDAVLSSGENGLDEDETKSRSGKNGLNGGITTIRAQFWDCGWEYLNEDKLVRMLEDSKVTLIFYDITKYESYENAVSRWLPRVRKNCPGSFIVLVGAKSDQDKLRAVEIDEVELFCKQANVLFMEISSKTRENVDFLLSVLKLRAKHGLNERMFEENKQRADKLMEECFRSQEKTAIPVRKIALGDADIGDDEEKVNVRTSLRKTSAAASQEAKLTSLDLTNSDSTADQRTGRNYGHFLHESHTHSSKLRKEHSTSPMKQRNQENNKQNWTKSEYDQLAKLVSGALGPDGQDLKNTSKYLIDEDESWVARTVDITPNFDVSPIKSVSKSMRRSTGNSSIRVHTCNACADAAPKDTIDLTLCNDEDQAQKPKIRPCDVTLHDRPTESYHQNVLERRSEAEKNGWYNSQTRPRPQPILYVDISLEGKKIGTIGVRDGDRPGQLASAFVRKKKLDPTVTPKLRSLLQSKIDGFCAGEVRKSTLETVEQHIPRLNDPFSPQIEDASMRSVSRDRPIIGTLHIKVDKARVSRLIIRDGDDPKILATNFKNTFALREGQAEQIEEHIRTQLEKAKRTRNSLPDCVNQSTHSAKSKEKSPEASSYDHLSRSFDELLAPSSKPDSSVAVLTAKQKELLLATLGGGEPAKPVVKAKGDIIFNLDINIRPGMSERIVVRRDDDLHELAKSFCEAHNLNAAKVNRVEALLKEKFKIHC